MSNHILHPIGDRTLCSPDHADGSAPHVSTGPDAASCSDCIAAYGQARRAPLAIEIHPARIHELDKRARQALARHREGDMLDPDDAVSLTPVELLALFQQISAHRSGQEPSAPPAYPAGVLPPKSALLSRAAAAPTPNLGQAIQELMADPEVTKEDLVRALAEGATAALASRAQDSTSHYNKKAD